MAATEVITEQNDPARGLPFGPGTWRAILCSCEVPVCQVPQDRPSSPCIQVAQEPLHSTILFMRQGVSTFPAHFINMIQTSKVLSLQVLC